MAVFEEEEDTSFPLSKQVIGLNTTGIRWKGPQKTTKNRYKESVLKINAFAQPIKFGSKVVCIKIQKPNL